MANKKITELTAAGALAGTEPIEIVQGGVNKQTTTQAIANLGGAGGGHTIEDEGTPLTQRTKLNFVGAGVTVTDDAGDDASVVTIDGTTGAKVVQVAFSDQSSTITAGSSKVTFRMPFAMTVTSVRASLKVGQTSGNIFTVDIHESGVTILSTKITIDNTEKTSTTATTPPVISDSSLADDAEITVDVDQIGDGTAIGGLITLIGS